MLDVEDRRPSHCCVPVALDGPWTQIVTVGVISRCTEFFYVLLTCWVAQLRINFWVPLTSCFGDASLWAESAPGKGNFHPFEVEPGQAVRFYGNQCLHFTSGLQKWSNMLWLDTVHEYTWIRNWKEWRMVKMAGDGAASRGDNKTDSSRVSFDFRAIRMRDFHWSQVPPPGDPRANEVRWSILDALVFGCLWTRLGRMLHRDASGSSGNMRSPLHAMGVLWPRHFCILRCHGGRWLHFDQPWRVGGTSGPYSAFGRRTCIPWKTWLACVVLSTWGSPWCLSPSSNKVRTVQTCDGADVLMGS